MRIYISKPVGSLGEVRHAYYASTEHENADNWSFEDYLSECELLDEEEIINGSWKEELSPEMSLVVISGYEKWNFPREFMELEYNVVAPCGVAQVEGNSGFQISLEDYSDPMDTSDEDFSDIYFDNNFEMSNDRERIYFKQISKIIDRLGLSEELKPYHIVVSQDELYNYALKTHFYRDKEQKCIMAKDKAIRMIED